MYLAIVLLAGAHGLMFLPVMLSLIGPHPNAGSALYVRNFLVFHSLQVYVSGRQSPSGRSKQA